MNALGRFEPCGQCEKVRRCTSLMVRVSNKVLDRHAARSVEIWR